jgi:hypothetical protein
MTIAAPPTATTNPRFTTALLCVVAIRQDQTDHPGQYGSQVWRGYGDLAKNLPDSRLIVICG